MSKQRIPIHSGENEPFTPLAFSEMAEPPAFILKTPSRRDREEMQYSLQRAGLRRHTDEDMREAMIEELFRLWNCDEEDENVGRLRSYWAAIDEYNDAVETHMIEVQAAKDAEEDAPPDLAEFEHPDVGPVNELIERLLRSSERLRSMGTDNARFGKDFQRYAIAHAVTGWTGLTAAPKFEAGVLKFDAVCELQEELEEKFPETGVLAFTELAAAAVGRFYVTKATEKNSASGPASQQTPSDSKEAGSASPNGNSQESDSSEGTPGA